MAFDLNTYIFESIYIKSAEELLSHYDKTIKELGYEHNVFIFFPPRKDAQETQPYCPHFTMPEELVMPYIEQKLYSVGPMFEDLKTTGHPVIWSRYFSDEKRYKRLPNLQNFIQRLTSHGDDVGYNEGITIPIFDHSGCFGHFSFILKGQKLSTDCEEVSVLFHICTNLMKHYLRVTNMNKNTHTPLTLREKEVLGWVLKGKSNSVIADIMEISEHTVATYIRRSSEKLGASSRWSAAVTAVLMGIIQY